MNKNALAPVGGEEASTRLDGPLWQGNRLVLKLGSRLVTGGGEGPDRTYLSRIAGLIAARPQLEVVLVSSGAVAAGYRALGLQRPPTRLDRRQAAAAIGQGRLMQAWAEAFDAVGLRAAQVLLTNDCLTDRRRFVAAQATLSALLEAGVVPVVNENDTVSTHEIRVGDNDNLAAVTAALVGADLLALATDVEGVYTADPARHPDARIVERTTSIAALRRLCFAKRAVESTGGMATKLDAAERVQSYGIPTVILGGRVSGALEALFDRHPVGTLIEPAADDAGAALDARRHWIAVQTRVAGALVVDEGALAALERRASLLPSGIVRIEGRFRRGDIVAVKDPSGRERGRGVARFDDWEVERVRGLHTAEARHLLGSGRSAWVVRPDQFVLMNAGEDEA